MAENRPSPVFAFVFRMTVDAYFDRNSGTERPRPPDKRDDAPERPSVTPTVQIPLAVRANRLPSAAAGQPRSVCIMKFASKVLAAVAVAATPAFASPYGGGNTGNFNIPTGGYNDPFFFVLVPEPTTWALYIAGGVAFAAFVGYRALTGRKAVKA
jgi:hypothetical protein